MSDKKQLLKEALKRHKQILEYTFYIGEEGDKPEGENVDNLLLGSDEGLTEQEDVEEDPFGGTEQPTEEPAVGDETVEDPFGGDTGVEDEMGEEEPNEEEVEVDVTDIVNKTEEAKEEASQASSKIDDLLSKFGELEEKLGSMDAIISKMDELEKEVIQRNPTPVEKLNMRSMDSFPYSIKLTDFWAEKEGYKIDDEEKENEYTLTQGEVESDYSETDIKNSFKSQRK